MLIDIVVRLPRRGASLQFFLSDARDDGYRAYTFAGVVLSLLERTGSRKATKRALDGAFEYFARSEAGHGSVVN
jgi:hypothetical protein